MASKTATAVAFPNIAFIKERLAKLGRTNGAGGLGAGDITGGTALYRENQDKTDRMRPLCRAGFTACPARI